MDARRQGGEGKLKTIRVCIENLIRDCVAESHNVSANGGEPANDPHHIAQITPLVALLAGILILIVPRLLSFIVAIYLIIVGLIGLNAIHHFIR